MRSIARTQLWALSLWCTTCCRNGVVGAPVAASTALVTFLVNLSRPVRNDLIRSLAACRCASVGEAAPVPNSSRRNGRRAAAWRFTLMDCARSHGISTAGIRVARATAAPLRRRVAVYSRVSARASIAASLHQSPTSMGYVNLLNGQPQVWAAQQRRHGDIAGPARANAAKPGRIAADYRAH